MYVHLYCISTQVLASQHTYKSIQCMYADISSLQDTFKHDNGHIFTYKGYMFACVYEKLVSRKTNVYDGGFTDQITFKTIALTGEDK